MKTRSVSIGGLVVAGLPLCVLAWWEGTAGLIAGAGGAGLMLLTFAAARRTGIRVLATIMFYGLTYMGAGLLWPLGYAGRLARVNATFERASAPTDPAVHAELQRRLTALRRSEEPFDSLGRIDKLGLRHMLRTRQFDRLDSLLSALQAAALADPAGEPSLYAAYDAFGVDDSTFTPMLDAWVARGGANPAALLARGVWHEGTGWSRRGEALAGRTSHAQFEAMGAQFQAAMTDLREAVGRDRAALPAYWTTISMAMAVGDRTLARQVLDQSLTVQPAGLYARRYYMISLRPRWGGSVEEMEDFADECDSAATGNPALKSLRGFVAMDRGEARMGSPDGKADFEEALRFGHDSWFLEDRAWRESGVGGNQAAALRDIDEALRIAPDLARRLRIRSVILVRLYNAEPPSPQRTEHFLEAVTDGERAWLLDPRDPDIVWWHGQLQGWIP